MLAGLEPLLLAILDGLRQETGVKVYAHVILPDHLHMILHGTDWVGGFMRSFKLRAVRRARVGLLWQERFYDHVIRNDEDLSNHLDYLHFNPVKHGWSATPEAHAHSSFRRYLAREWYLPGWGHALPQGIAEWEFE
jgi:putative transposase